MKIKKADKGVKLLMRLGKLSGLGIEDIAPCENRPIVIVAGHGVAGLAGQDGARKQQDIVERIF